MATCHTLPTMSSPEPNCTKGDLATAQNLHKQAHLSTLEVHQIVSEGQKIRQNLRDVVTPWRYETRPCIVAMQGFCNQQLRNTLLRTLQNFYHPLLIHASQVGKDRWESILLINIREGALRRHYSPDPKSFGAIDFSCFVQCLQTWVDRFRVQANVIELSRWCDLPTLTSIDRINAGSHRFGNWHHEKCARYVYEYLWRRNEVHREQQNAYVRENTGLEFSVGNMMQVSFERQNLELEIATLRSLHAQTLSNISTLHTLCSVHATVLQELRLATVQRMQTQRAPVMWPEGTAVDSRLVAAIESHDTTMQTIANLRNSLNPQPQTIIDLTLADTTSA